MNFGVKDFLMSEGLRNFMENNGLSGLLKFPILAGEYDEFSAKWYRNVGSALCLTILLNILSP